MDVNNAFKLFDIRGQYPQVVDERLAFVVAKALSTWKKPRKVLVAFDTRESSPSLKEFLIDGFTSSSIAVYDLFEVPIPEFYYTLATNEEYNLGVMVTASHVSDDENGFKFAGPDGLPFDQQEIATLRDLVARIQNEQIVVPKFQPMRISNADKYIADLLRLVGDKKPNIKLSLDISRSSVLTTVMTLFQKLNADFHLVNSAHSGNPLLEQNRRALVKDVMETGSDLGVIWDSDGDRVVFIGRTGKLIPIPFVLGLLAADAIKRGPGKKAVIDVRSGLVVRDLIIEADGEFEVLPAWSQFMKFAMRKDKSVVFGGETSGHFTFADFHIIDDGILAALRFIRIFENGLVEEKLKDLDKKYFELPEKNFTSDPQKAPDVLQRLTEHYRALGFSVSVEDGLTVFGDNFKFNLRQSVTEPFMRLNLEVKGDKKADEIVKDIEQTIAA